MKSLYKTNAVLLLLLPLCGASFAGEPQKAAEPMQPGMDVHQGIGMGTGMMGGMTEEQKDQHLRAIQEHMLIMHNLSNQILAETDPVKKRTTEKPAATTNESRTGAKENASPANQGTAPENEGTISTNDAGTKVVYPSVHEGK